MGSRRTAVALRRRAAIALAVWTIAFAMLAVVAAIPEGPTAAMSVDDAYPAVGQVVHFNASASAAHDAGNGRIIAYRFAFGDGQGTSWQSVPLADHAYAAAGTFVATVTVVDDRGAEGTASVTVHPGVPTPPPGSAPDLVPIQAQLDPLTPTVNTSVNVIVVVLNRGGGYAEAALLSVYDISPNGTLFLAGAAALSGPLAPSQTSSIVIGPFVVRLAGDHTLRVLVTNVTPAEMSTSNNELDLRMTVFAGTQPAKPVGGGEFAVSPIAVGLGAAVVAAGVGTAALLLRPRPAGPLEPPSPHPPDRSPPPIWPP